MLQQRGNNESLYVITTIRDSIRSLPSKVKGDKYDLEKEVIAVLERIGLSKREPLPSKNGNIGSYVGVLPPSSFVFQPCGSQRSPDILINTGSGCTLGVELKSSSDDSIMLNSTIAIKTDDFGIPVFYILTSFLNDRSRRICSVLLGEVFMPTETTNIMDEHKKDSKELTNKSNKKFREQNTYIQLYPRFMIAPFSHKNYPGLDEGQEKTLLFLESKCC